MEIKTQEELINIDLKWKNLKLDQNKVFVLNIKDFITDEHIDIVVRYLYIKSYIENKDYNKYKNLYEKMMLKRVGKTYYKEFNKIIDSFNEFGYLKEYPIPINKKHKILNGSHRLACCLYFNINPYVYIFDEPDHTFSIDWFKNNEFTEAEINEILKTKEELLNKYTFEKVKLEKIYTAMITPLKNDLFDKEYFIKHADNIKNNNINGLFLCGNTGSGMDLSFDTKKEILELANTLSGKFSLICHVGSQNINDIEKLIELTNRLNIKCIASMPPYKTINTFFEIKKYYEYIANISTKPVLIYHIPTITNIDLEANQLVELLNINNVIGIKYTDANLEKLKQISSVVDNKYIFYGKDDLLLNGIENGATGGIGGCYNLFPSFIYNIINNESEKIKQDNQNKLNFCIKKLRKKYPDLPGGKFVLCSLDIKNNRTDDEFYNFLGDEND